MNFDNMKYFISAAEIKNFSQTARAHQVTPAAISLQIAAMEEELGFQLFHRESTGLRLTHAGEYFYESCIEIINLYSSSIDNATNLSRKKNNTLYVGVTGPGSRAYFFHLNNAFYQEHPEAMIHVEYDTLDHLQEKLLFGIIDVMFDFDSSWPQNEPSIIHEPLGDYRYVLLLSKKHRFAGRKSVSQSELKGEKIYITNRLFTLENLKKNISHNFLIQYKDDLYPVKSFELIRMYIEMNAGVTFVPEKIFDYKHETCETVPVEGIDDSLHLMICIKKIREKNALIESFARITKSYFNDLKQNEK